MPLRREANNHLYFFLISFCIIRTNNEQRFAHELFLFSWQLAAKVDVLWVLEHRKNGRKNQTRKKRQWQHQCMWKELRKNWTALFCAVLSFLCPYRLFFRYFFSFRVCVWEFPHVAPFKVFDQVVIVPVYLPLLKGRVRPNLGSLFSFLLIFRMERSGPLSKLQW